MFSLSTSWCSANIQTGFELLKKLEETGFEAIELDYRITESIFEEIYGILKRKEIVVTSIHNYFPHPDDIPREQASGDLFSLSSLDRDEREKAVKYTCRTIQVANDLEVPAIVLHLGKVDMDPEKEKISKAVNSDEEAREILNEKLKERKNRAPKHLDALFHSLEKVNKEAERQNVLLGIETRYNYHEIPDFEEIGLILKKFDGSQLKYWHDTGHAQVNENLGIATHEDFLKEYKDYLIGLHIHDAREMDDHWAPGYGNINFDMIAQYWDDTIRVLEVHPKVTLEQLIKGRSLLIERDLKVD